MSTTADISEVASSSIRREFRLSPRCIIAKSETGFNSGATSVFPSLENSLPFNGAAEQQVENGNHPLTLSNSKKHLESKMNFHGEHSRQNSALSSTSNEISQYLCHPPNKKQHSRPPSLLDSPLSATSWSFHSRQSSLEGISMDKRGSNRRIRTTPSPLNRPPPPLYCNTNIQRDMLKQTSPSSVDLGYHTLVNNNSHYNNASNSDYNKDDYISVLNHASVPSTPPNIFPSPHRTSSRSNSNLSKSSLRKDISLLPEKHHLTSSVRNSSRNGLCDSTNLECANERVHMDPTSQTVIFKSVENTQRNRCPFDYLSNELILKILSNLSTIDICLCAQVCRRLYFLAWEPKLWKSINLDGNRLKNINADHAILSLFKVLSRDPSCSISNGKNPNFKQSSSIQNVVINSCSTLSDNGLLHISDRCPELRRLELPNCSEITNTGIQAIATLCTSLDHLDLMGKFF